MRRRVLRFAAIIGTASVATLAVAPAFAAAPVSQATAQSIDLQLAGNSVVSQLVTATNDGTGATTKDSSTIPTLAGLLPKNNTASVGVAPQEAAANVVNGDGISYACAGVAGTGGGLVKVGNKACNITPGNKAVTLDLANVDLGGQLLGEGAITSALQNAPGIGTLLQSLGLQLTNVAQQLTTSLKLPVALPLSVSTIEGACQATPAAAQGDATLADAHLDLTVAGTSVNLVNFPLNPAPNTSLTDLNTVTAKITSTLQTEFSTALNAALVGINPGLATLQSSLLTPLSTGLVPLTDAIKQYLADIVLNEQSTTDGGKKIAVTALHAKVLPNNAIPGGSLLEGKIGAVTCGPNGRVAQEAAPKPGAVSAPKLPDVPKAIDSGLAGHGDHTARNVLGATAALLLLAGTAGLVGYRRMLHK